MRRVTVPIVLTLAAVLLAGCASNAAFVASKMSGRFHKPSCAWAAQIHDKDRLGFATRDEAIKAGKTPCPTCKP